MYLFYSVVLSFQLCFLTYPVTNTKHYWINSIKKKFFFEKKSHPLFFSNLNFRNTNYVNTQQSLRSWV